jgi:hypothetical protein
MHPRGRSASRDEAQDRLCDLLDRKLGLDRHPISVVRRSRLRARIQRERGDAQARPESGTNLRPSLHL